MNDRIKELAKQAGDYVNETYTGPVRSKTPGKIWEDGHIGWHTQFNEKFAELIVKECTNYMNSRTKDWDAKLRWIFNDGSGYMEVDVDSLLKEHFGVEE
jgi:hypothetical protein